MCGDCLDFGGAGARPLILGLGGAAGPPMCAASLWLLDFSGIALTLGHALLTVSALGFVTLLLTHTLVRLRSFPLTGSAVGLEASRIDSSRLARFVGWMLVALVAVRLCSLLMDVTQRPLFPWDAWKTWAWKARVWFEAGALLPFQSSGTWVSAPANEYVIDGVNHPGFVSLVMLWSALAVGEWNDRFIGLPWFMIGIWSAFLLWGILRFLGKPKLLCWLAVYLLLSLPLVNSHIALFGYSDLWMMFHFAVFSTGFVIWARRPGWSALSIMAFAAVMLSLTKDSGVYWLPALVIAVVVTRISDRVLLPAIFGLSVLGAVALWVGIDPVALLSSGRYQVTFQPVGDALRAIGKHMFVWLDWHLLWYVMPFALAFAFWLRKQSNVLRGMFLLAVVLLGTAVAGFVGTRAAEYAMVGTLFGRVLLAIVPVFVLLLCLSVWEGIKAFPPAGADSGHDFR